MDDLYIRCLDPSTIRRNSVIGIVGNRGCGKSEMVNRLLGELVGAHGKFDFMLGISSTQSSLTKIKTLLPFLCKDEDQCKLLRYFDDASVGNVMSHIQNLNEESKTNDPLRTLIVMDDCLDSKSILNSKTLRRVFMNGRSLNVSFLFTLQNLADLGPANRCNIDYLFAFRDSSSQVKIWDYFFRRFVNYKDFCIVMNTLTQNYSAMVLDTTSATSSIEDSLWYFNSSIVKPEVDSEIGDGRVLHVVFGEETSDVPVSFYGITLPSWVSSFRSYLCF